MAGEIDGVEVEWTLGALLNELLNVKPTSPTQHANAASASGANEKHHTVWIFVVLMVGVLCIVVVRRVRGNGAGGRVEKDKEWA